MDNGVQIPEGGNEDQECKGRNDAVTPVSELEIGRIYLLL